MRISDLIVSLEDLSAEYGDLTVLTHDGQEFGVATSVETRYENLFDGASKKFKNTLCVITV